MGVYRRLLTFLHQTDESRLAKDANMNDVFAHLGNLWPPPVMGTVKTPRGVIAGINATQNEAVQTFALLVQRESDLIMALGTRNPNPNPNPNPNTNPNPKSVHGVRIAEAMLVMDG